MTLAFVGLGANLGDARATIVDTFAELAQLPQTRVTATSSLYASAPVDAGGPDFVNAVAALDTGLDPHSLLAELLRIEARHGRTRAYRNAPRTLDLDLLLHGESLIDDATLTLPHPRMTARAFVLVPLAEIAPHLVLPSGQSVASLAAQVREQKLTMLATRLPP